MALALGHPDWVVGFQDEVWWSRLAQPNLHTWTEAKPLRQVAYLRATANVSGPFPIRLRGLPSPALSPYHVCSSPAPSLLACI
jgi:hypothetical protein